MAVRIKFATAELFISLQNGARDGSRIPWHSPALGRRGIRAMSPPKSASFSDSAGPRDKGSARVLLESKLVCRH